MRPLRSPQPSPPIRTFVRLFSIVILGIMLGCRMEPQPMGPSHAGEWQPGRIIETQTGRVLSFPEWLKEAEQYQLVYLGEEHYNPHHVGAAIRLVRGLLADGVRPVLAMEMFGWDGQAAVDRYLSGGTQDTETFLEQAQWKTNWGGSFEPYGQLVSFAKERQLPLWAMNPPKPLIRRVVKLGLTSAAEGEDWTRWGLARHDIIDDAGYRAKIFDQLRRCHGGGTDDDYRTMYEASLVRDEGMAKTLVAALEQVQRDGSGRRSIIVSYTGGGHIQYGLPVPSRVTRRLGPAVRQATVYLISVDSTRIEEIQDLVHEPIADYVWLTQTSGQGPVQRCR